MAGGAHASAEQRLRLYETLLQTTPDLVYMWDLQHRFTYANARVYPAGQYRGTVTYTATVP